MHRSKNNIAIIGAGAISLLTAYRLVLENKYSKIIIFDKPNSLKNSATYAAGAMEAVIGEVEHGYEDDVFQSLLVENGLKARLEWDDINNSTELMSFTAGESIVFLNDGANDFEKKNYQAVVNAAQNLDSIEFVNASDYFNLDVVKSKESVIKLPKERAFNPRSLVQNLKKYLLLSGVEIKSEKVLSVDPNNNDIRTSSSFYNNHFFDHIIISAGTVSCNLLPKETNLVPLLNGVGTALFCKSSKYTEYLCPKTVYRSVNRGGSQCGLHLVPNSSNEFYIGAGNALSWQSNENYRFETIRYLMNQLEDDLMGVNSMYSITGDILMGNRVRTADYLPLLGPLSGNSSIIIATGFNRVGLTMAPLISKDILNLLEGNEPRYFPGYLPDRNLIPYGTIEQSSNSFSEVTCANLIEHGLVLHHEIDSKKQELLKVGYDLNNKANSVFCLQKDFGHTPDALSVLAKYEIKNDE
jgi:glycine/D-amino acid oxidase-like deaminating enzyme